MLSFQSWQEFFDLFYSANASALAGRQKGVEETNLRTFLQALKMISDRCGLMEESGGWGGGLTISSSGGGGFTNVSGGVMRYGMKQALAGCGEVVDLMLIQYAAGVEDGAAMGLLPGLADGAWVPPCPGGDQRNQRAKRAGGGFSRGHALP